MKAAEHNATAGAAAAPAAARWLLACALALLSAAPVLAADARLLGSTRLSQAENDVDVVEVACRPRISEIQLRARRGQVEIERLWVRYGNGKVDRLTVADRIAEGGATRWIDLRAGKRCVVAVGVIGDTERSLDQARVEIYGR